MTMAIEPDKKGLTLQILKVSYFRKRITSIFIHVSKQVCRHFDTEQISQKNTNIFYASVMHTN